MTAALPEKLATAPTASFRGAFPAPGWAYATVTVSPYATAEASVTVTVLPSIAAVPVPAMLRAAPPSGVALTANALPAGAEPAPSAASKLTASAVPITVAPANDGAIPTACVKASTSPPAPLLRRFCPAPGRLYCNDTVCPRVTAPASVSVSVSPDSEGASGVCAAPSTRAVNAVRAGTEPSSSAPSKTALSVAPLTEAPSIAGGVRLTASNAKSATSAPKPSPRTAPDAGFA